MGGTELWVGRRTENCPASWDVVPSRPVYCSKFKREPAVYPHVYQVTTDPTLTNTTQCNPTTSHPGRRLCKTRSQQPLRHRAVSRSPTFVKRLPPPVVPYRCTSFHQPIQPENSVFHVMNTQSRLLVIGMTAEFLYELAVCPIEKLRIVGDFLWLAPRQVLVMRFVTCHLRSLKFDIRSKQNCANCQVPHFVTMKRVLDNLCDDQNQRFIAAIRELSIDLLHWDPLRKCHAVLRRQHFIKVHKETRINLSNSSRPHNADASSILRKIGILIRSRYTEIELFSLSSAPYLSGSLPELINRSYLDGPGFKRLENWPLTTLTIPLNEYTIHHLLNGSQNSLWSSLRRFSLDADAEWFERVPCEATEQLSDWLCQRPLERLALTNIILPRYPNVSELSMDGHTSRTTSESPWISIATISTLRTLKIHSRLFTAAKINGDGPCSFQCQHLSTLYFEMVDRREDPTGVGPYIFNQVLSSCKELSTIEVTGTLWGSKMNWPGSVETIRLKLDEGNLSLGKIFGNLHRVRSLKTLMFSFPKSVESPAEYLSLWNHIVHLPKTCPLIETFGIYDYKPRIDGSDDEQSDDGPSDDEPHDTPERGLEQGLVKTNWQGLTWEFADAHGSMELTVTYPKYV